MSITNMNPTNICYTGTDSLKTGNHTKKQFLDIMNKYLKKGCSNNLKFMKCKSCKKLQKIVTADVSKQIKAKLKNKTYKTPSKTEQRIIKQRSKCEKCKKNTRTRKCKLKDYMLYSGAEVGLCP